MTQAQLDHFLVDQATLWPVASRDNRGQPSFAAPLMIRVRWEELQERFVNDAGEEEVSRALVFVDRVVAKGSRLLHGLSDSEDPASIEGTFPVRVYRQNPDLHNPAVVLREVVL